MFHVFVVQTNRKVKYARSKNRKGSNNGTGSADQLIPSGSDRNANLDGEFWAHTHFRVVAKY